MQDWYWSRISIAVSEEVARDRCIAGSDFERILCGRPVQAAKALQRSQTEPSHKATLHDQQAFASEPTHADGSCDHDVATGFVCQLKRKRPIICTSRDMWIQYRTEQMTFEPCVARQCRLLKEHCRGCGVTESQSQRTRPAGLCKRSFE